MQCLTTPVWGGGQLARPSDADLLAARPASVYPCFTEWVSSRWFVAVCHRPSSAAAVAVNAVFRSSAAQHPHDCAAAHAVLSHSADDASERCVMCDLGAVGARCLYRDTSLNSVTESE